MVRSFVISARGQTDNKAKKSRHQVRGTSQNKGDRSVETQSAEHRWEEVVEATGREMHVLDEAEQVKAGIPNGLHETRSRALALLETDRVSRNTIMRKLTLFLREPPCLQRRVWEKEESDQGNSKCYHALDAIAGQSRLPVRGERGPYMNNHCHPLML